MTIQNTTRKKTHTEVAVGHMSEGTAPRLSNSRILEIIGNYITEVAATLEMLPTDNLIQIVNLIEEARLNGRRIYISGNGGSAATASHFTCDLSKGAICDGKPRMKVFSLTDSVPLLTAWANDNMYRNTFAEQIENLVERGDIVIAISGSGDSWNVLKGLEIARSKGAKTVGFTGFDGGKVKELVDVPIIVPSDNIEQVEDIHLLLTHVITACLREAA